MGYISFFLVGLCVGLSGSAETTSKPSDHQGKIIGGFQVSINDYPYQIFLNSSVGSCGGSIISATWILTAAHCLDGADVNTVTIRTGSTEWAKGGTVFKAKNFTINPKYNPDTIDYDLALIELEMPLPLGNPGTNSIPLTDTEPPAGRQCVVTGWGRTSLFSQQLSPTLKATYLTIRSRLACWLAYPGLFTQRMICASNLFTTACNGDSGGPLVDTNTNQQVGIVSYGKFCLRGTTNAFTNVANQRSWIKSISGV